jgi:transketolase
MITLDKINSRTYSRLGQRGAIFGMAACDAAKDDPKFILLTADLAQLSGMDRYVKIYPDQFVNAGIAEQNMLGMAAGLAAEGYHPCASTYATFITMRSCEQLRHYFGYMNLSAVIVGSGAGLCQGYAGNTHYTIEDISMVRAIPNICIFSPADAGSAVKLFEEARNHQNAVYIRLTGNLNCPIVYKEDADFKIGGSNIIKDGDDVTIFATGTMVSNAFKAANLLEEQGVSTSVVDMYSLKPIDEKVIMDACNRRLLVSVEEHNVGGGLGSIISEVLTKIGRTPRLLRLGINDVFNLAGSYDYLLSQNRLQPDQISEGILRDLYH